MNKNVIKALISGVFLLFSTTISAADNEYPIYKNTVHVKGIYLTQYTFENTAYLNHLIKHAKASGIDTFVIDMELPSKRYQTNLELLKENNINYVARITMFPEGGTEQQVETPDYWQKRYHLVKLAVDYGAKSIQLDYIRYKSKQPASSENAKNVLKIIQWYKTKLAAQNIPLQVDVFGIASYGESKNIGQSIPLFSQSADVICPMVYPSHYTPFAEHFKEPYETIYDSILSIRDQFDSEKLPMKLYPYIELSNYHFPMTHAQTLEYIKAQIKAVEEAGADGWYAWSPHNRYDNLFAILEDQKQHTD
jgi:hypothetical protein